MIFSHLIKLGWALALSACFSTGQPSGCGGPWPDAACRCEQRGTDLVPLGDAAVPQQAQALSGGTVRIRVAHEPGSLLSLLDVDPIIKQIADHSIFESLVRTRSHSDGVTPELALSWEAIAPQAGFTFHLDPNARWHDGQPLTAEDVRFTVERLLDPGTGSVLRHAFEDISDVIVVDAHTVTLLLDRPRPDFLRALSALSILPAHVFGRTPLNQHVASRAPIGSGPFRFDRWLPGQLIELTRTENWRGPRPRIDRLVYRIVPDLRVAFDLLKRQDLDILPDPPMSRAAPRDDWRLITYPLPRVEAWVYNVSSPVFNRQAARRAVGLLIDTEAIRCSILRCRAERIDNLALFSDPDPANANGEVPQTFDPQLAKQMLIADGWIDHNGDGVRDRRGVEFSFDLLLPDASPDLKRIAVIVQNDLAQVGIQMRLALVSWSIYISQLQKGQFDASVIAIATTPPFSPLSLFHSRALGRGYNFGRFVDPELDELLDTLREESDEEKRRDTLCIVDERLTELQPFTFTFRHIGAALINHRLGGVAIREGWLEERTLFWRQVPDQGGRR